MPSAVLNKSKAGIKIADTTLMSESEEELKSLLRVKEESERSGLKLNIQKPTLMASGPITSCQMEEEKVNVVTDFFFLGSKITADSDCSHEIRRQMLLGTKATTNLDSVLKSREITDKGLYSQGYGLPSGHIWF